jgi:hypothetical protein
MNNPLMQRALQALEESLDAIRLEYASDWRHDIPSRQPQIDGMRALLEEHEAVIRDLRAELAKPQPAPPDLDAIKAEAKVCLEWPDDWRGYVSISSTLLFARHCAEKTANGTWP